MIDGRGVPLAVAVDGANVPDQKLVGATLDSIPIQRPTPTSKAPQHLCLDKGDAGKPVEGLVRRRGYEPRVPRKANEPPKPTHRRGKARRWKVERTHSWLNRARRRLVRWEKKADNYLAFLHIQSAIITLRAPKVLGEVLSQIHSGCTVKFRAPIA